ncbi:cupin domain-containing protein [Luteibacter sp. ME-Dv--P-043b]|uniref:cupin domain-containing protein n=1 Tax=Luteibacter sp. ME-Dv--P-043b TaxID=3040291 RepID=UPI0025555C9A|nr:cupin domain-containing protein [Luteibacter sp. ME-Dv--P-043b]
MIELWRWVIVLGEVYESQGHPSGTMELFHVEEGELRLLLDGRELVIPYGSAAVVKTDVAHSYICGVNVEVVFTMAVAELHRPR